MQWMLIITIGQHLLCPRAIQILGGGLLDNRIGMVKPYCVSASGKPVYFRPKIEASILLLIDSSNWL
jgi:hypothetical protein